MLMFSPHMFLFFSVYNLLLLLMLNSPNFYIFWILIEVSTLVFMGTSYSTFKNNFSSLLIFFIVQTLAAFILLVMFCFDLQSGFTAALLLKMSMFPFYFWYLNLVRNFPNFIFIFSRTLFKIPAVALLYNFFYILNIPLIFLSAILTLLFGAVSMLVSSDLRSVLIASSVVNNSWFFIAQLLRLFLFLLYFFIYSLALFYLVKEFRSLIVTSSFVFSYENYLLHFSLFTLAGLPPFPLFYAKMIVVYGLVVRLNYSFFAMVVMLLAVVSILSYLKQVFARLAYSYNSSLSFCFL